MLRATPPLLKMASTKGGMRRILKRRLPVPRYIELAVKAGTYKTPSTRPHYLGLHDVPEPKAYLTPREREERIKLRRGILDYPTEYEILSLNPPLPDPPRTPVRVRKAMMARKRKHLAKLKKERRRLGLPEEDPSQSQRLPGMDRLVKNYLRRHEEEMRAGVSPIEARRKEDYYSRLLLGPNAEKEAEEREAKFDRILGRGSLGTAMGRRSALVENAYAFSLRQQQVMLEGDKDDGGKVMTEEESAERVKELLKEEARADRRKGHKAASIAEAWRAEKDAEKDVAGGEGVPDEGKKDDGDEYDESTLPSILHGRPRAVRALNVWSSRMRSIPYSRWTIGAATALDHWIAREVLQMDERTWLLVVEGGGADAYREGMETLPGGETRAGIMDRMRDIRLARGALFPETLVAGDVGGSVGEDGIAGDLEEDLLDDGPSATEKSIDDLLKSLGEAGDDDDTWKIFDDDEEETGEKGDDDDEGSKGRDEEELRSIVDELQVWRARNVSSPYESWDADRKAEFDKWIESYVSTFSPEADAGAIDLEATRASLLAERPVDGEETKEFWGYVRTETEADAFLRDYRTGAKEKLDSLRAASQLSDEEEATASELEAILSVPYDEQLQKLVDAGTLRPILDEYATGLERDLFLEKYAHIFLEGLETEHLVPDPDGPVGLDDLAPELREEVLTGWRPGDGDTKLRFAIRKIAYGTDEYGTQRAERAREIYRMWNEHRANRARFEEAMFKRGRLGLEENGKPRVRRGKKERK